MSTMLKLLGVIAIVLFGIVIIPLAAISSLNTLFGLTIPISFDTWCAAVVLIMVLSGFRK